MQRRELRPKVQPLKKTKKPNATLKTQLAMVKEYHASSPLEKRKITSWFSKQGLRHPKHYKLLVRAIETPNKYYLMAHGSLKSATFTVPCGVVIVFMTYPGSHCWGTHPSLYTQHGVRDILEKADSVYSSVYYEKNIVQDQSLSLSPEQNNLKYGIWKVPLKSYLNNKITKNNVNYFNRAVHSEKITSLSEVVDFMKKYSSKDQPLVLFVGSCRSTNSNSNFKSCKGLNEKACARYMSSNIRQIPPTITDAKKKGNIEWWRMQTLHTMPLNRIRYVLNTSSKYGVEIEPEEVYPNLFREPIKRFDNAHAFVRGIAAMTKVSNTNVIASLTNTLFQYVLNKYEWNDFIKKRLMEKANNMYTYWATFDGITCTGFAITKVVLGRFGHAGKLLHILFLRAKENVGAFRLLHTIQKYAREKRYDRLWIVGHLKNDIELYEKYGFKRGPFVENKNNNITWMNRTNFRRNGKIHEINHKNGPHTGWIMTKDVLGFELEPTEKITHFDNAREFLRFVLKLPQTTTISNDNVETLTNTDWGFGYTNSKNERQFFKKELANPSDNYVYYAAFDGNLCIGYAIGKLIETDEYDPLGEHIIKLYAQNKIIARQLVAYIENSMVYGDQLLIIIAKTKDEFNFYTRLGFAQNANFEKNLQKNINHRNGPNTGWIMFKTV